MPLSSTEFLVKPSFPSSAKAAFSALNPAISTWFAERYQSPTLAQRRTWPSIAAGNSLLLCAPTGSGKTLAAFAPILSELLPCPGEGLRCLYVSPLKALVTDVRRTLRRCANELRELHAEYSAPFRIG